MLCVNIRWGIALPLMVSNVTWQRWGAEMGGEEELPISAVAYDFQLCTSCERGIWNGAFNYIDQITQHSREFFILLMQEQSMNHVFLNNEVGLDVMQG